MKAIKSIEVGVHAPEASSIDGQLDSSVNGDLNKPINQAPTISMQKNLEFFDLTSETTYRIYFSKSYRQQLLAVL